MSDRTCEVCGKVFQYPRDLKQHQRRKTPCTPILLREAESPSTGDDSHSCRYCRRTYSSKSSAYRHMRFACKIANSAEGMDKLMNHALQRQADATESLRRQSEEQNAKIDRLTALLEQQLRLQPLLANTEPRGPDTSKTSIITNITQIFVIPWNKYLPIKIDAAHVAAAFAENPRLQEYLMLDDEKKMDPAVAPAYVMDLFMDLTRRVHTDPATRNVYLNPKRADQVMVLSREGPWEYRLVLEATRDLNDGIAKQIMGISRSLEDRKILTIDQQNALAMAGLMYEADPDEYARRMKSSVAAHFANLTPTSEQLALIHPFVA